MRDIPLIDISGCRRGDAVATDKTLLAVEQACRNVGFMYITGHGITAQTINRLRNAVIAWFAQPLAVKLHYRISRANYRGYIPAGFFSANSGELDADCYEGYKLHFEINADDPICSTCDLYGPNKWPQHGSELEAAVEDYWQQCDQVLSVLLQLLARILCMESGALLRLFDKPLTNMTLLHYPPPATGASRYGIHPHKDTDVLTLLAPDPVGGLLVKRTGRSGWIKAEAPGEALVVNTGDLLELWSGGYFVSTPHKVESQHSCSRYSFPYFAVPRYDTVVTPVVPAQPGFSRAGVHVGDVSREVWRTNWPDVLPTTDEFELGTLPE